MYKYKQNSMSNRSLTESNQKSVIRWKLLLEKENILEEATPWLMCTDYFNDVVLVTRRGLIFDVHGFSNRGLGVAGDMFLSVKDTDSLFKDNVPQVNAWLKEHGHEQKITFVEDVEEQPKGVLVLHIPRYYITNTAYMSIVLAMLRACSYNVPIKNSTALFKTENKLINMLDGPLKVRENFKLIMNPRNKEYLDDIILIYKTLGSEQECVTIGKDLTQKNMVVPTTYYVHNAGIHSVALSIDAEKLVA